MRRFVESGGYNRESVRVVRITQYMYESHTAKTLFCRKTALLFRMECTPCVSRRDR